jgi:hypothetical protein
VDLEPWQLAADAFRAILIAFIAATLFVPPLRQIAPMKTPSAASPTAPSELLRACCIFLLQPGSSRNFPR